MPDSSAFESISVLRSDQVRTRAQHLAGLLSKKMGVPVKRYTAITIAIERAIKTESKK